MKTIKPLGIKVGGHILDRIILATLDEQSGDQLGAPIHTAIARIAAESIREGIALRRSRNQSLHPELLKIDAMPQSDLEALCLERVHVCCH